jgi:diacylglycerol kinase (ATP)
VRFFVRQLQATEHRRGTMFSWNSCHYRRFFIFDISKTDWLFQTLAIGLVLSVEGLNTAVEKMADFIHPIFTKELAL